MPNPEFCFFYFSISGYLFCQVHCQCNLFNSYSFSLYIWNYPHFSVCICAQVPLQICDETNKKRKENLNYTCPSARHFKKQTFCHSKTWKKSLLKLKKGQFSIFSILRYQKLEFETNTVLKMRSTFFVKLWANFFFSQDNLIFIYTGPSYIPETQEKNRKLKCFEVCLKILWKTDHSLREVALKRSQGIFLNIFPNKARVYGQKIYLSQRRYHDENASFSICIQNRGLDWEINKRSAL